MTSSQASEYLPQEPSAGAAPVNHGWFRAMRNPEALELLTAYPNAFKLAYIIAFRGQYSATFNRHNLAPGEALLGDHDRYGMSEQNYRTAKKQLAKWHFATFKPTTKGTIAKLTDTRLFSIFRIEGNDQDNGQLTDSQRTGNGRVTTTKNIRAEERKEHEEWGCSAVASPASTTRVKIGEDWLQELASDPAYAGIDVPRELAKMERWCVEHRKQPTRRRLLNWLNRCDLPITRTSAAPVVATTSSRINPEDL